MIRILIVDDQNLIRQGIQAILESHPTLTVVGTADNGQSAIEQAKTLKPDIILMDVEMADMNGIDATRQITQQSPKTKIIILSSHNSKKYVAQALKAGAEGYLLKNTLAEKLEKSIFLVYQGQIQIEPGLLKEILFEASYEKLIISAEQQESNLVTQQSLPTKQLSSNNYGNSSTIIQKPSIGIHQIESLPKTNTPTLQPVSPTIKPKINQKSNISHNNQSKKILNDKGNNQSNNQSVKSFSKKKNSYRFWKLFIVLGIILGGSWFIYRRSVVNSKLQAQKQLITVAVEKQDVSITIGANGTIRPEKTINISPRSMGVLKSLFVEEGESVKQGQVLAHMDDRNLQGQLVEIKGQLASAQANLQRLLNGNRSEDISEAEAQLSDAKTQLRQAESTLAQNQSLYEVGAISRRDFEDLRAARDSAQARVIQAQQAFARQKAGARVEDIDRARAEVVIAQGRLKTIQNQLQDLVIRAPFSGIVSRKFAEPGAFVSPTTAGSSVSSATSSSILSLATNNQIIARVSQSNIAQISIGQKVLFEVDAFPGKTFTGKVTKIAVQSTVEDNVTSFEVKIAILDDSEQVLLSGMDANLEFQVGELQNALIVPNSVVVRRPDATGVFVTRKNKKKPIFTPITTGATVDDKTVVKSGLTGNERLLVGSPNRKKTRSKFTGLFKGLSGKKR